MADDQRKPWVLPVFFGLLILLFWVITDVMKPPAAARVSQTSVDDGTVAVAPVAMTATATMTGSGEALSPTAVAP